MNITGIQPVGLYQLELNSGMGPTASGDMKDQFRAAAKAADHEVDWKNSLVSNILETPSTNPRELLLLRLEVDEYTQRVALTKVLVDKGVNTFDNLVKS
jgi:hypothetical protein